MFRFKFTKSEHVLSTSGRSHILQATVLLLWQTSQRSVSIILVQLDWLSVLDFAEIFTDRTTNFFYPWVSLNSLCLHLSWVLYERRPILGIINNPFKFLNHLVSLWPAYMCAGSDKCTAWVYNYQRPRFTNVRSWAQPKHLLSLGQTLIGNRTILPFFAFWYICWQSRVSL